MKYEKIVLDEKKMVGLNVTTSNRDPQMRNSIGQCWAKYISLGISQQIKNKVNDYPIACYSDYSENNYQVTVGNEISINENPELTFKTIPKGLYAKFTFCGPMPDIIGKAWQEIWNTDLNRRYRGDFEEYISGNTADAKLNIYIALNDHET